MHHTHIAVGLLLAAPLLSQAAEITLTINGKITSAQITEAPISNMTDQDRATAAAVMAPLKVDQNVSLSYTFDTDQLPWSPEYAYNATTGQLDQLIGGRFGSVDGLHGNITTTISVPDAGISYSHTAPSNTISRFVRTRAPFGNTTLAGTDLDFQVLDDQARFSSTLLSERAYDSYFSFTELSGKDWEKHNLFDLLSNFNYWGSGRFNVLDPSCTYSQGECGYARFDALSTTLQVSAVPEPSSWTLMSLGLVGIIGAAFQRHRHQRA